MKNAQNAHSGPWWDPTSLLLGLETINIVFIIQIRFRNCIKLLREPIICHKWPKMAKNDQKKPKTLKMLVQGPGGTLCAQNWALRPLTSFLAYKLGSETASTSSRF